MGHKFDDLILDRDRWRAIVNAAMKTSGSIKCEGFFRLAEDRLVAQDGRCPMELFSWKIIKI
jgi:hypothetical protein